MGGFRPRPASCPRLRVARNRAVCRVSVIPAQPLSCRDDQKDTAKPSPALDSILRDSFATRHAIVRWRCPETRRIASKLGARGLTFPQMRVSYRILSWLDAAFHSVMLRHGSADGLADSLSIGFLLFEAEI